MHGDGRGCQRGALQRLPHPPPCERWVDSMRRHGGRLRCSLHCCSGPDWFCPGRELHFGFWVHSWRSGGVCQRGGTLQWFAVLHHDGALRVDEPQLRGSGPSTARIPCAAESEPAGHQQPAPREEYHHSELWNNTHRVKPVNLVLIVITSAALSHCTYMNFHVFNSNTVVQAI